MKKFIKNNTSVILLILIIGLGSFLRVYKLADVPYGFFCDEASIGYNGFNILLKGTDEFGKFFPLYFQSFGDYKPGLPIYSTVPSIFFLGLNEFSVRLPFALYGTLLVGLMYGVGKNLYSRKLGIIAAGLSAISPWLIHYSRIGFELITFPTIFMLSFLFLLKSRRKPMSIPIFFIFLGLTFYTYRSSFLITPLFLIAFLSIYKNVFLKNIKLSIIGGLSFIIISAPFAISILDKTGLNRFQQVSLITQNIPYTEKLTTIFDNYFYQLNPSFLFLRGDTTFITRHFNNGFTPLYLVMAPFLFFGLVWIIKNHTQNFSKLAFIWILIYPISGSLAGAPFTSRSIIGAPIIILLTAMGIIYFSELAKRKFRFETTFVTILLFFLSLLFFFNFYFFKYPLYSSNFWGWQYGARDIINYFVKNESQYDQLIMAPEFNAPEIFFKFYAPNDCKKCMVGLPDTNYDPNIKQLFAVTSNYLSKNPGYKLNTKKIIYYPNGSIAFRIGEIVK